MNYFFISGLFIKQFNRAVQNDNVHSLAEIIPDILVHYQDENTAKKYNSVFRI